MPEGTLLAPSLSPTNEFPMTVPCPQCWDLVETKVEFSAGALTYFLAILLIMFGFICFACIPCCVNVCKDAHHFCPKCHYCFGVYKRLNLSQLQEDAIGALGLK
ncbi:hypothetical protein QR680_013652 [Steinernema hermaphroditum]|uniref:LITAF domain-containing protein n=1 Tax=Steinernema hermaphroditum TaxID=289476 RepID=A0AA39M2W5_9BILA|nr:hypothetical protein QR680_013652 [Steinernema hermaphroditum]